MFQPNEEYIAQINSLIPMAEFTANGVIIRSNYKHHEQFADAWNRVYHDEMDRLASEAGLRNAKV